MSVEEYKGQVQRWIEALNDGTAFDCIGDVYAPNFVLHDPSLPEPLRGHEALAAFMRAVLAAFPDCHYTIDDLFAEGDRVVLRASCRATHQGEFAGVPATGKEVTIALVSILRFENGKAVEEWQMVDSLGLMQQLGAIPAG